MNDSAAPNNNKLAALLPRLMAFARLVEGLANRFKGLAGFLALSGLGAALWLGYVTLHSFGFSLPWAAVAGGVLALPGLVMGFCWYVLDEATGLPQRLADCAVRLHGYAVDARQQFQGAPEKGRTRFRDLGKLAGLAYDVQSLGSDARDLLAILGGSLTLANPLFLFALGGSAMLIGLLNFLAVLSGLVYLFR